MSRHKYNARAVIVDGQRFDSQGEYDRFWELQQLEKVGMLYYNVKCTVNRLLAGLPSEGVEMTGSELITQERQRQIEAEGWTPEHDDRHEHGELYIAASCYMCLDDFEEAPELWPWSKKWWKPKDRVRNLVRAGALIAAEIDRLQRKDNAS